MSYHWHVVRVSKVVKDGKLLKLMLQYIGLEAGIEAVRVSRSDLMSRW